MPTTEPTAVERTRERLIVHMHAITAMMKAGIPPTKEYFNIFIKQYLSDIRTIFVEGFSDGRTAEIENHHPSEFIKTTNAITAIADEFLLKNID